MANTDPFQELLRIVPRCEAEVAGKQCTKNGVIHMVVTHEKRAVQAADMCRQHATVVAGRARKEGYTVTFEERK